MINKPYPTRAELNDIYNSLELGADGLVLAAETAIGKYPRECVTILDEIIKLFKKKKLNEKNYVTTIYDIEKKLTTQYPKELIDYLCKRFNIIEKTKTS